tara:strand:+ start:164 stop:385 length:222 start_codon:yes stop_codon:yes gene_type:complete
MVRKQVNRYLINYIPAQHKRQDNKEHTPYLYDVEITDFMQNWTNGESFAGFSGKVKDGFRSFRWDRVVSIVAQ